MFLEGVKVTIFSAVQRIAAGDMSVFSVKKASLIGNGVRRQGAIHRRGAERIRAEKRETLIKNPLQLFQRSPDTYFIA